MGKLAPSGRQFLRELLAIAELAVAAAKAVRDSLGSGNGEVGTVPDIAAYKNVSDELAAAVMAEASHALVPPIDRDDAIDLARRMARVPDAVRRVSEANKSLQPVLPDVAVSHLAELLVQATDFLEGAATTLTDPSRAFDFAGETQRTDREGEHVYTEAIGALFARSQDPLCAVRQAEFYRSLRESLRACARAAASIQRIALKQFVA